MNVLKKVEKTTKAGVYKTSVDTDYEITETELLAQKKNMEENLVLVNAQLAEIVKLKKV